MDTVNHQVRLTARPTGVEADVARQATWAAEHADLVLLVVDVTTGITEDDAALAVRLRRSTTLRLPRCPASLSLRDENGPARTTQVHRPPKQEWIQAGRVHRRR